jgi:hypothetical protein
VTVSGKSNEFKITTLNIFIDFTAVLDTITRNEIYVIMAEFDYPTKLIPLTKTTMRQNTERLCGIL